jgi:acylphosphatase
VVRAHLWVSGRVQGVGFRFFVQRQAASLGLAGCVRNLADGRVEIQAEGPAGAVERLVEAVHRGPPGATVQAVDVTWERPVGESAFTIRAGGSIYD